LIQKQILVIAAAFEAVLGPLVVCVLINKRDWELPSLLGFSCLIIGFATLLTGILTNKIISKMLRDSQLNSICVSISMAVVLMGGFFAWQYDILESNRTERPFALQIKSVVESYPPKRVAFYHRYGDKMLFYMKLNPPVTFLTDVNDFRAFLESGEPGIIISQNQYMTKTVASMLPSQPAYAETCYKWESSDRKYRVWLINQDNTHTKTKS
jgi:hypothetical protein